MLELEILRVLVEVAYDDIGLHADEEKDEEVLHVQDKRGMALGLRQFLAWPAAVLPTDRSMIQSVCALCASRSSFPPRISWYN